MTMDPSRPVAPSTEPTPEAAPTWSPAPASATARTDPEAWTAPVAPVVAVAPRRKSGGVINLLLVGAAILAIGGVAFAVGRTTAPVSASTGAGFVPGGGTGLRPGGSFAPGAGGFGQGGFGQGGAVSLDGTVTAVTADSITVTLANGTERTFTLDGSTTYREATTASADAVAVGDNVSVKVAGGGRGGTAAGSPAPDQTATDVTVAR
jgi:hypothetical protein